MKTPTIKWAQNDNFIFIDILIEPSSDCIINIKNNCLNFKQNDYECELELYDLILENDSKIKKNRIFEFYLKKKESEKEWKQLLKDKNK